MSCMRVLFFLKQVNESFPSRNLLQLSFQIGNVFEEIFLDALRKFCQQLKRVYYTRIAV